MKKCKQCGVVLKEENKFCGGCGSNEFEVVVDVVENEKKPKKKNKKVKTGIKLRYKIIFVLILLFALTVACVGYVVGMDYDAPVLNNEKIVIMDIIKQKHDVLEITVPIQKLNAIVDDPEEYGIKDLDITKEINRNLPRFLDVKKVWLDEDYHRIVLDTSVLDIWKVQIGLDVLMEMDDEKISVRIGDIYAGKFIKLSGNLVSEVKDEKLEYTYNEMILNDKEAAEIMNLVESRVTDRSIEFKHDEIVCSFKIED